MEKEIWRLVDGYENYEVSNYGKVRNKRKALLAQTISTTGYYNVGLSRDNISKTFKVHRLVAKAFIPKVDGLNDVNHIDGDKLNNLPCNLEWSNKSENALHAYYMGLTKGKAGLTNDSIIEILKSIKRGCTMTDTAKAFNVDIKTVWRIRRKQTHKRLLNSLPQDLFN